jgi:hypothetical protein
MLIEFKIQLDDNGGATVVPASVNTINTALPKEVQLGSAVGAAGAAASGAVAQKGGDAPLADPGSGKPSGVSSSSGSGIVFVLGPIVICGSGPNHTGPGGDAPLADPGTGKPNKSGS